MNKSKFQLTVQLSYSNGGIRILLLKGRDAWTMHELIKAGVKGCTPIDNPAPRWSAYIHNLRKMGVSIETVTEPHGGDFAGDHGRYILRDTVAILSVLDNRGGSFASKKREETSNGQSGT